MAEDWAAIAAEAAGAIADIGFAATVMRKTGGPVTPWDTGAASETTYPVTVIDSGIKRRYDAGTLIVRQYRSLMVGATGFVPAMGDTITLHGVAHEIQAVKPTSPGGVDLLYAVEIGA